MREERTTKIWHHPYHKLSIEPRVSRYVWAHVIAFRSTKWWLYFNHGNFHIQYGEMLYLTLLISIFLLPQSIADEYATQKIVKPCNKIFWAAHPSVRIICVTAKNNTGTWNWCSCWVEKRFRQMLRPIWNWCAEIEVSCAKQFAQYQNRHNIFFRLLNHNESFTAMTRRPH